jgi:hypothetical protein
MTVARQLAVACIVGAVSVGVVSASAVARSATQRGSLAVVRVTSSPKGKGALSSRHLNTVVASTDLAFTVGVRNTGARRHVTITVTVSPTRVSSGAIVMTKTVWLRAHLPGTVKIGRFMPVPFAVRTQLKVSVWDVRTGEVWTTAYPVIFSLG